MSVVSAVVMDWEAEMELHNLIFYGGNGRPVGVQVTLLPQWFSICKRWKQKPSVRMVKRYWALMQAPEDSKSMTVQLHMIKRAMIEWPKMGAAIAKLAQKQFHQAKKEAKLLRRRQLYKNKKMLWDASVRVARDLQANHAADCERLKVQNANVKCRLGQKVTKK